MEMANLRFHHKGKFGEKGYVDGEEAIVKDVDLDRFSYTVLMEFVKEELEYTEIGGIYAWKCPTSGWKLVADDVELLFMMQIKNNGDYIDFYVDTDVEDSTEPIKQMQPHVIVRPRKNLFPAANSQKRQFVSSHHLQQVAKKKQQTDQVFTPRKSTRLNNSQMISEAAVSPPINNKQTDQVFTPRKSARLNNPVTNNPEVISKTAASPPSSVELPHNEGIGTMTAYLAMRERQKINSSGSGSVRNKAVVGNVSKNIENEEDEVAEDEVGAPRRLRGNTKMDKVHSRPYDKRVVIQMNDRGQPISDDDQVMTELSYYLGTLKRSVPLTYKSWFDVPASLKDRLWSYVKQRYIIPNECEYWALRSIRDAWRGYKSRIKKAHYMAFETDEERLENRPDEIPLQDFKVLLQFWGDDKVHSKALTNSANRKSYTDMHTAGPKLFSQIRHKMAKESDGELYVKTHKRKEGKVYKTDASIMNYRIEKIEKAIGERSNDGVVHELVSDGKSHGPSWLIGRHTKSPIVSKAAPTAGTYIQELATKIREDIAGEVEAKVNKMVQSEFDAKLDEKVQENLTRMLKKLGEANPHMHIDIGDFSATVRSEGTETESSEHSGGSRS